MFSFFKRRREKMQKQAQEIATTLRPQVLWLANDITKGQGIDGSFLTSDWSRGYLNGYVETVASRYRSSVGSEGVTLIAILLFTTLLANLKKKNRQGGGESVLIPQEPAKFYIESSARQTNTSFKSGYKDGHKDAGNDSKSTSLLSELYLESFQALLDRPSSSDMESMLIGMLKEDLGPGLPISSGNGTKERPFVVTAERDYVSVEYVVAKHLLSILREDFKMKGTSLLRQDGCMVDELAYYVRTTGNSPKESVRNFYFDITHGYSKIEDSDPPVVLPFNPTAII